jgi:hypothetical protein
MGIMEKGKITSESPTVSQEFAKAMISEKIKKGADRKQGTADWK